MKLTLGELRNIIESTLDETAMDELEHIIGMLPPELSFAHYSGTSATEITIRPRAEYTRQFDPATTVSVVSQAIMDDIVDMLIDDFGYSAALQVQNSRVLWKDSGPLHIILTARMSKKPHSSRRKFDPLKDASVRLYVYTA